MAMMMMMMTTMMMMTMLIANGGDDDAGVTSETEQAGPDPPIEAEVSSLSLDISGPAVDDSEKVSGQTATGVGPSINGSDESGSVPAPGPTRPQKVENQKVVFLW